MDQIGFKRFDFSNVDYEKGGKATLVAGDTNHPMEKREIVAMAAGDNEKDLKVEPTLNNVVDSENLEIQEQVDDASTKHKFRIEKADFSEILAEIIVALENSVEDYAGTKKERDNANKTISGLEKTLNNLPSIMVEGQDVEDIGKALKENLRRNIEFLKDDKVKKILSQGLEKVAVKKKSISAKAKSNAEKPSVDDSTPAAPVKTPVKDPSPAKPPTAPPAEPNIPDAEKISNQEFVSLKGKIETLSKSFESQLSKDVKLKLISEDEGKEKEKMLAVEVDKFKTLLDRFNKGEMSKELHEEMQAVFFSLEEAGKNIFDYIKTKNKKKNKSGVKKNSKIHEEYQKKFNAAIDRLGKMSLDEFNKARKEVVYDGNLKLYYETIISNDGVPLEEGKDSSDPQFKESFKKAFELAESIVTDKENIFTIVGGVTYKILQKPGSESANDSSLKELDAEPDDEKITNVILPEKDAPADPFKHLGENEKILDEDQDELAENLIAGNEINAKDDEKTQSKEDAVEDFPDLGEGGEELFRKMLQVYYNEVKVIAKEAGIKWKRGERKEALKEETVKFGAEWFEKRFPKKKITNSFVEHIFSQIKK